MTYKILTSLGLALGFAALSGCAPPPPVVVAPAAPPPVAMVAFTPPQVLAPPPPVWAPPVRHHYVMRRQTTVTVVHRVVRHYWVHRYYAMRTGYWSPRCGSSVHPCSVEHQTVPIE